MRAKHLTISAITVTWMVIAAPASALADASPGSPVEGGTGGNSGNGNLSASASQTSIQITHKNAPPSGDSVTPVNTDWTPPVCWYEPVATPKQLKKATKDISDGSGAVSVTPSLGWGIDLMRNEYGKKSKYSKYGNYNLSQQGEGKWYRGFINPNRKDEADWDDCEDNMFWVKDGTQPPQPEAISPKILAEYAYDEIRVPDTKVTMNPKAKSTVNLPTWMWLDKAEYKPIEVTASLPGTGLSATTTAKPVALHLDPGTKDAQTHPTSGECPINEDGSIGTPYTKGNSKKTPPCGITYERSTNSTGPHKLKAKLTWEISWEGSNNEGGNLPDGAFDTTQNITVGEVQTIN